MGKIEGGVMRWKNGMIMIADLRGGEDDGSRSKGK